MSGNIRGYFDVRKKVSANGRDLFLVEDEAPPLSGGNLVPQEAPRDRN